MSCVINSMGLILMLASIIAVICIIVLVGMMFDFLFPLLLVGGMIVGLMTMTNMIVWEGNSPNVDIQRGIEWIESQNEADTKSAKDALEAERLAEEARIEELQYPFSERNDSQFKRN